MKKIILILFPILFSVSNGISQVEEHRLTVDSITVFMNKCSDLNLKDILSWKPMDKAIKNGTISDSYDSIKESSIIKKGIIKIDKGDSIYSKVLFNVKTYNFKNRCKSIEIIADVYLEEKIIAQKIFIQTTCNGIVEYQQENYFIKQFNMLNDTLVNNKEIYISPNPTSDIVNLQTDLDISKVYILDLQGKQLQKTTSKEVDLSKLSSGIYLIKVKLKNNEIWTSKVIKN